MDIRMETVSVIERERKLDPNITIEYNQEIESYFGLHAERDLARDLKKNVFALGTMMKKSKKNKVMFDKVNNRFVVRKF